jgi:hypothetical protein
MKRGCVLLTVIFVSLITAPIVYGWNGHPLLTASALSELDIWDNYPRVEVKSLEQFLLETEDSLLVFLAGHEAWSRAHLPNYAPLPEPLAFRATGDVDQVRHRFLQAIRINPHVKIPLYLHHLPGQPPTSKERISPTGITIIDDTWLMDQYTYVRLSEGEFVLPFDVLTTATDEPDFGFDIGLFKDNGTDFGQIYGFGDQSFGNPNLVYGSQAPFHMGFFHEAGILYAAGPFLRRTWIDYRIFLFRALSEFAFRNNQPYWGWRFMGWGMHYVGDVSMPYHMKPLPGVSTCRMIGINALAMLGMPGQRDKAVQLVSNRHTVFEALQWEQLMLAYETPGESHPYLMALRTSGSRDIYSYEYLLNVASLASAKAARYSNKVLKRNVPHRLVSDASVEVSELTDLYSLSNLVVGEFGEDALIELNQMIAQRLMDFSVHLQGYLFTILASVEEPSE